MARLSFIGESESVPVVAFTLDGDKVEHFANLQDAGLRLGLHFTAISNCLTGHSCRAGDYIFVKQSEYTEGMKITYASIKRKRNFLKGKK